MTIGQIIFSTCVVIMFLIILVNIQVLYLNIKEILKSRF